jgi:hypothetical protein
VPLGQPTPAFSPFWQHDPANLGLKSHGRSRRGKNAVTRRRRWSFFSESAARSGRGGGARGALECGGLGSRCEEVRGSLETLVRVGAVGAEGCTGEGPLRGLWRSASSSWKGRWGGSLAGGAGPRGGASQRQRRRMYLRGRSPVWCRCLRRRHAQGQLRVAHEGGCSGA